MKIEISNENELKKFIAEFIAQYYEPNLTILLLGDLGAGKTTFAKYFINNFFPKEEVTSPTFPLVNIYKNENNNISHYDLYRVNHPDELIELNLLDAFNQGITLIEWPEIAYNYLPNSYVLIKIEPLDEKRRKLTIKFHGK